MCKHRSQEVIVSIELIYSNELHKRINHPLNTLVHTTNCYNHFYHIFSMLLYRRLPEETTDHLK